MVRKNKMEIEKNTSYTITPVNDYGFEKNETWCYEESSVHITSLWKNGSVTITPRTTAEIKGIEAAVVQTSEEVLHPFAFRDYVYNEFSGIRIQNIDFLGCSKEECDEITEDIIGNGIESLIERNWYKDGDNKYLIGELKIEEV
jgi:hypothetical protein